MRWQLPIQYWISSRFLRNNAEIVTSLFINNAIKKCLKYTAQLIITRWATYFDSKISNNSKRWVITETLINWETKIMNDGTLKGRERAASESINDQEGRVQTEERDTNGYRWEERIINKEWVRRLSRLLRLWVQLLIRRDRRRRVHHHRAFRLAFHRASHRAFHRHRQQPRTSSLWSDCTPVPIPFAKKNKVQLANTYT